MDKVKKYFLIGLVSIILLGTLYIFNNDSLTGNFVYSIPADKIALDISQNDIPLSFFKCDSILSGKFKFNLVEASLLPADIVLENGNIEPFLYIDLLIFNYSSDGIYNYTYKKSITFKEFMDKTSPKIETAPMQLSEGIEEILDGAPSTPTNNFSIYNTTDQVILSNIYEYDLSNFNVNLPPIGNYFYSLNLSLHNESGEYFLYYIFFRQLSILDKNCYVPALIHNIPNLTFDGGSEEEFIDLSDYFRDAGGDVLTYTIIGGNKINLTVVNDRVNIDAPYYDLNESFYINSSDGINSTMSNLFIITIINESLSSDFPSSACLSNWSIGSWSECRSDGIRTRIVIDKNSCSSNITRPSEIESCSYNGGGEPLAASSPETQNLEDLLQTKNNNISDNKLFLSGIVLASFLLLILILLLLDWSGKRKEKNLIAEIKEKPYENPVAEYKPKFEAPVKQEPNLVNADELNKYVKDMLDKGNSIESVRNKLSSSGWNKEQIDDSINFIRVKTFVDKMLEKGQNREIVRKLLKDKGWKDEFINRILK